MDKNIIIADSKDLAKKRKSMLEGGSENLHILTDFDMTLTKIFVDGRRFPSAISILRDNDCLTPEYSAKAYELYDKYRPIEIDQQISYEEKKQAMQEWWSLSFDLLIESGLNKKHLEDVADCSKIIFRDGGDEFFDLSHDNDIPVVIMSSSALGEEGIAIFLQRVGKSYDNTHIISNSFEWDKNGRAVGIKKPIMHSLNKKEVMVKDYPFFGKVEKRKNVILMGDNLEDVHMIAGFDYDNLIKIGFLNEDVEMNLEKYRQNYDVVIANDAPMDFVNELLREIIYPVKE
jgi:5'-nucleotidase